MTPQSIKPRMKQSRQASKQANKPSFVKAKYMPSFTKQVNYSLPLPDFHILYIHSPRCNALLFFCRDNFYFCTCSRPVKVNKKVRQSIQTKLVWITSFLEVTCFTLQFESGLERVHWVHRDTPSSMPDTNIVFMWRRRRQQESLYFLIEASSLETPTLCLLKQKVSTIAEKC